MGLGHFLGRFSYRTERCWISTPQLHHRYRKLFKTQNYKMEISPKMTIKSDFVNTQLFVASIQGILWGGSRYFLHLSWQNFNGAAYIILYVTFSLLYSIFAQITTVRFYKCRWDRPRVLWACAQLATHLPSRSRSPFGNGSRQCCAIWRPRSHKAWNICCPIKIRQGPSHYPMVPSTQTTFERREGETPTAPHPFSGGEGESDELWGHCRGTSEALCCSVLQV